MSKKIKTLIAALAVLALLGGGYYGATIYQKKKAAAAASQSGPASIRLGNFDSSKLAKIEVSGLTLEKKGEAWALVSLNGGPVPSGVELDEGQISNRAYSFASVWVDQTVEDAPADLSIYGLDAPASRISVTDTDGKNAVYLVGNMTPSRSGYYVMQEGDPKVYTVSSYSVENMQLTLSAIRQKSLLPVFEIADFTRLRIDSSGVVIDISPKPEPLPAHLGTAFSTHLMTSPYKLSRGVDSEALTKLLEPLFNLMIVDFVDEQPSSLAPYGLDKPVGMLLETTKGSIELLIGNDAGGNRYAKLAGAPGVFTVGGLDSVVNARPFALVDKFAYIVNIDNVDKVTVTGGAEPLTLDFEGKGDEGVYSLNGKKAETKSFRTFYQSVIGLLSDAEYPGAARNPAQDSANEITIAYQLNTPAGGRASITLIPYDRDYYVLRQEGTTEFLISRNQVRNLFDSAEKLVYAE